jgi:predicted O-methyltransferase YrrM
MKKLRRNKQVRHLIVAGFKALQHAGISVVPSHFYWPIPDLNQLGEREWPLRSEATTVELRLDQQLEMLETMQEQFSGEYSQLPDQQDESAYAYHRNNGLFETVDAEIAYCLVRRLRCRRIIEIGSGFSTRVMAAALRRNQAVFGDEARMACVEPHPDKVLKDGIPGVTALIRTPGQKLCPDFVEQLEAGDILFIDSSHVVAVGSDVAYEILELLPRLKPGVLVHLHDIFFPADYPRELVMDSLSFWSEQYLLQAFLAFNPAFEVVWASSAMQLAHANELERAFPAWAGSYAKMPEDIRQFIPTLDRERVWPSSFWMKRVN